MAKSKQHPLDSDRGFTTIEQPVVTSIVSVLTREAEKIQMSSGGTRVPGDNSPTVGEFFSGLVSSGDFTRGVSVEVDDREAAVDLTLTVPYGESIPQVTQAVRDTVVQKVKDLAGIDVTEVNITVDDVALSEQ
ncbi:MAG: Asp23/Gls24 family envelope stress response protein [Rubrobacteraceae bacterium]